MKTSKGGRKISLPWFRQNSVQQNHAALTRQHTIDTPGSFRSYVGSKKLQVNCSANRNFSYASLKHNLNNYFYMLKSFLVNIHTPLLVSKHKS